MNVLLIGSGGDNAMPVLDSQVMRLLHLRDDQFGDIFTATEDEIDRAEVFFTIING